MFGLDIITSIVAEGVSCLVTTASTAFSIMFGPLKIYMSGVRDQLFGGIWDEHQNWNRDHLNNPRYDLRRTYNLIDEDPQEILYCINAKKPRFT